MKGVCVDFCFMAHYMAASCGRVVAVFSKCAMGKFV